MNLGEKVREAAVREAEEECGLNIEIAVDSPMDVVDSIYRDDAGGFRFHYVLLQFLAKPREGKLKPGGDVLDAKWVLLVDVETCDLTKAFRSFFKKHRQELEAFDR